MTPDTLATVAAQAITTGWSAETSGGYALLLVVLMVASVWQSSLWMGE